LFIGVIGATGNIGQHLVAEAAARGHRVLGFTRNVGAAPQRSNVSWASLDIFDTAAVAAVLPGLDVLVSLYQPGNAAVDFDATVRESIADPTVYATAAHSLLSALNTHPRTRLLVVGGAGSLETAPGCTMADEENLGAILETIGLPAEYATAVRGHRDALNVYRTSNRQWTYLSPAGEIGPGERTGRYRVGGDQPVVDGEGRSRISFADAAVALIDEIENPRFIQRRFTIGY